MSREFSGVFGLLAYTTIIARGFLIGGGFDETIKLALIMLFAFAVAGYVLGGIAQQTVRESVLAILEAEGRTAESNSLSDHAATK